MSKELRVQVDNVLAAAKDACPDVQEALRSLFLEAFIDEGYYKVPRVDGATLLFPIDHPLHHLVQVRCCGPYEERGLFVSDSCGIEIIKERDGKVIRLKK